MDCVCRRVVGGMAGLAAAAVAKIVAGSLFVGDVERSFVFARCGCRLPSPKYLFAMVWFRANNRGRWCHVVQRLASESP